MNRTAQECIRPQTVRLACRLLSPLLDAGTITTSEYTIIRKTLSQLLKSGEPLQVIKPKLLTPQEAAEMLKDQFIVLANDLMYKSKYAPLSERERKKVNIINSICDLI